MRDERDQSETATLSLAEILGDFNLQDSADASGLKSGGPVTIWLPADYKAKYDRLQKASDRRFCKKARKALQALIDLADQKIGAA